MKNIVIKSIVVTLFCVVILIFFLNAFTGPVSNKKRQNQSRELYQKAQMLFKKEKYQEAIDYFEKSLNFEQEIRNKENEAMVLGELGKSFALIGQADKSIRYLEKELTLEKELDRSSVKAELYCDICSQYRMKSQFDLMTRYCKVGLIFFEDYKPDYKKDEEYKINSMLACRMDLISAHLSLKQNISALKQMRLARKSAYSLNMENEVNQLNELISILESTEGN